MTKSRIELMQLTLNSLAFIQDVHGYELEQTEPNELLTTIAYKFDGIAVELCIDWRDLDVACLISKLSDGRLPEGYLIHDGQRVRYRLSDLTTDVLTRFRQLPQPSKHRGSLDQWASWQTDRMAESIRIYADILQISLAEIRSEAGARFQAD